ncbi:hypothetical protein F7R91_26225 [Streptomyces luteolifulvus]|uniref:Uncharacterized protein n=2 Tax=Streptomyces luteolifulvus TaxID=2615112 RepID=A0A6H9UVP7_9ACTN|nr:DUF6153 family protein [Streptomyces luteolifulvus]KAB1143293.1 hypothetical protein F7R91_26225 [Streptomyces luteolifulvus]
MWAVTAHPLLRRARSPLGRWRLLLGLGLLAGLFGMHALGPGGVVVAGGHHSPAVPAHAGMVTTGDEVVCHGDGSGGGHAQHADPTCASGAVGAGPVLPVLVPDPVGTGSGVDSRYGAFVAAIEGGRAPPSLAELQLLRI